MRVLQTCLVLLLAAPLALAQPPVVAPGLYVEGETTIVVTKVPFLVVAPEGFKLYFWRPPVTWTVEENPASRELKVTAAPEGTATVSVSAVTLPAGDVSAFKLSVSVGKVIPPTPPAPSDPIFAAVQTAYAADASPTKSADRIALAAVYTAMAESLGDVTTAGNLFTVLAAARKASIDERLPTVRAVFGTELGKYMPTDPAAPLTDALRTTAKAQLTRYAAILTETK